MVWFWCRCRVPGVWTKVGTSGPPYKALAKFRYFPTFYFVVYLAPTAESRPSGYTFFFCFLFFKFIFNDSYTTTYLKINRTNVSQIFRFGRTVALDDQSDISFSIPQEKLPWKTNFVRFYRAMLCIRGTSHRPVSVCLCLCLSVCLSVTSRCSTKTAKGRIT